MNVLSLFDGMSCGQIALERAGIKVDNYYASEIKKHAIATTQANYPSTIQVGDVTKINASDLPKIDLLIGGSPCQDFSRAHSERKGLAGEKSSLFFEYVRILNELKALNPDLLFLLENVIMDDYGYSFISNELNCDPVRINSELVSGQLRDRLYWTNIKPYSVDFFGRLVSNIKPPKNKLIQLSDILTDGYTDRRKSRALLESDSRPLASQDKMWHRYKSAGFTTVIYNDKSLNWEKGLRYLNQTELERLQTVPKGYTKNLARNHAACLLGDGWTVDVIAHIFKGLNR